MSLKYLYDLEHGVYPIPEEFIKFYAKSLSVKSSHLNAVLFSSKNVASSRPANRILKKYFGLILKLKKHEEE